PGQFREKRAIRVTHNGKSVNELNELEYIRGDIWANVYGEDLIYIINPKNGEVKGLIDCKNLLPARERNSEMVLNGIAFEPLSGKIFLTGKLWPRLYQVELVR
ncbi:MAG: glutaminyl-peptide cyclotransferase, partial [Bacteroidales bacterium]|nr:glutaminyl-peptide cyclotransferase [Bacteroidales bacterium]